MNYQLIDAEEHSELAEQFVIRQAPSLVLSEDGQVQKFINAGSIRQYADSLKAV